MKKVAIIQSNYIPWKGYFDIINQVDEFILFDDMQYTRRDWRNRNIIKTPQGLQWLTIPVDVKGKYFQKINETLVSEKNWGAKHWKTISHNYAKAPFFATYAAQFESCFLNEDELLLSQINYRFIALINSILGIKTSLRWSSDFQIAEGKTERLVSICEQTNATDYVSGPAARDYIDASLFEKAGVGLHWADYSGYSEYKQIHGTFEHGVSILDLIFNVGPEASQFMKSFHSHA
jgi:WbqC-like protein family